MQVRFLPGLQYLEITLVSQWISKGYLVFTETFLLFGCRELHIINSRWCKGRSRKASQSFSNNNGLLARKIPKALYS